MFFLIILIHFLEKEKEILNYTQESQFSEFTAYCIFCLSKHICTIEVPDIISEFNENMQRFYLRQNPLLYVWTMKLLGCQAQVNLWLSGIFVKILCAGTFSTKICYVNSCLLLKHLLRLWAMPPWQDIRAQEEQFSEKRLLKLDLGLLQLSLVYTP